MKKIITIVILFATFVACKKDSEAPKREVSITAFDSGDPAAEHYWIVNLTFQPQVTLKGSVDIEFDAYHYENFVKHVSEKVYFELDNENHYQHKIVNTQVLKTPSIRNFKYSNFVITEGNYNITIK